jgi:pyruvate dehydrogenase phosphatase
MILSKGARSTIVHTQRAYIHSRSGSQRYGKGALGTLSLLGAASAMTLAALYHNSPALNEAVKNDDKQRFMQTKLHFTAIDPNDNRPFEILSQKAINAIMRSGEVAYKFAQPIKNVSGVYVNSLRSNEPIEDHYSVDTVGSTKLIAGVYDGKDFDEIETVMNDSDSALVEPTGHIGPQCSILIKRKIPIYVAQHLEKLPMSKSIEKVMGALSSAFEELDYHIQQRFIDIFPKDISKLSAGDIRSAVTSRPDQVETRRIIEEAIHGSCASIAYVDGDDVYTANTGDSRSVGK